MKRIIDGVTYNTDTATRLARSTWEQAGNEVTGILYQTRGGAFFVHTYFEKEYWVERLGDTHVTEVNEFQPLNATDAHEWIMTGEIEIFSRSRAGCYDLHPTTCRAEKGRGRSRT
jgi:hypothetical protein